jgi:UDP-glucose 4-epimerase
MKKIVVTGGTGYIGSHTVVELQNAGFEVIIIDNLSNSYSSVVDNIATITGTKPQFHHFDLRDAKKTQAFFAGQQEIDGVIHFAALKAVGESMKKSVLYYKNNLISLLNVLDGMQQAGINNLVFSSSCTVYGQPDQLPVTEQAPIKKAYSPYGHTKQIAEEIIENVSSLDGMNAILLRYFNPIGAHESALIGELPLGVPNNLIPFITQTAIGIRDELKVFGDDYDTPDGTAIRDYIHVVDLAKAHVIAMKRMLHKKQTKNPEIFNLGTGKGFSVLEVIHAFENVSGQKLKYKIGDRRAGDTEQVWAATQFANQELGWKAEKSIDEMMASAWKWELALHKKKEK